MTDKIEGRWFSVNYEELCMFIHQGRGAKTYYLGAYLTHNKDKFTVSTSKSVDDEFDYKCGENYLTYGFGKKDLSKLSPLERENAITISIHAENLEIALVKLDNEECEGDLIFEASPDSEFKVKILRKSKFTDNYKVRIVDRSG